MQEPDPAVPHLLSGSEVPPIIHSIIITHFSSHPIIPICFLSFKRWGFGGAFPFWKCLIYWKQKIQMPHSLQNEVLARKDHAAICLAIFAVIILLIRFIILGIRFGFINYFRPKMHFYKVFPAEITQVPA